MYSKGPELAGFALVALGVAMLLGPAAGLIVGGVALLFIGSTVDDQSVGAAVKRATGWTRYLWHRQIARETGVVVPKLRRGIPKGWSACACGGQDECPVCDGTGFVPDPTARTNPNSPHPPLRVDEDATEFWGRLARVRRERTENGSDRLERIG